MVTIRSPPFVLTKTFEPSVQIVVDSNKIKFEPYDDLVEEVYSCYNADMLDNQDPVGQNGHDETGEAVYSNDQDNQNTETLQFSILCRGSWQVMKF